MPSYLGRKGVIAPPATGAGIVLAVFFDRFGSDSAIDVLDHETWQAPAAGWDV